MQCLVLVVLLLMINNGICCLRYTRNYLFTYPHISALVLARGGSKGLKLKNLQTVGNKTLLRRSLEQIKKANFTSIWVSTDHYLIAEEAEKVNVNIHWRAPDTATDDASSLHATQEFLKHHPEIDIVALIQCTSPFLKKEYLDRAIDLIQKYECVFSVSRSFKLFWKIIDGKLIPINFNPKRRPRRQDLEVQLIENGMFYVTSRKLLENGYFQTST